MKYISRKHDTRYSHDETRSWLWFDRNCITFERGRNKTYWTTVGPSPGGEEHHALMFSLRLPWLFYAYLSFDFRWLRKTLPRSRWWGGYETSLSIRDKYINLQFFYDEGIAGDLSGFSKMINVPRVLFGQDKYTTRDISITSAFVDLPEGKYPVTVRIFESTWKRTRWPWPTRMIRADVEPVDQEHGIPSHAGKGENSWDQDDDALFGMTCQAKTVEEAVEAVEQSILRDRARYGMPTL